MQGKWEKIFVSGIATEIGIYESDSDLHFILVPGNPGIGTMYEEFAQKLIQAFGGKLNLYILTYAGFTSEKPERPFLLSEELEHKKGVFRHLSSKWNSQSKIVLLGHSIGSWIISEMLKEFKEYSRLEAFMLFPFLCKSDNLHQKNFSNLLNHSTSLKVFVSTLKFFRRLPSPVLDSILGMFYSHASESSKKLIIDYITNRNYIVDSVVYLARDEFANLPEELNISEIKENYNKITMLYCNEDMWAPLEQMDQLVSAIPELRIEKLPLITHDFCVNADQCEIVANKIRDYLVTK